MAITEVKRASVKELTEFANKVREAGGGNPLDALMPAVPEDISQCLVARNLNFNCTVGSLAPSSPDDRREGAWYMSLTDAEIRDKIAAALELKKFDVPAASGASARTIEEDGYNTSTRTAYIVELPDEIAMIAHDFDRTEEIAYTLEQQIASGVSKRKAWESLDNEEKKLFRELWPYVERSKQEAYSLATLVTEDGKIVYR